MKPLHAYSLALLSQVGHFSCVKAGEDLLLVRTYPISIS